MKKSILNFGAASTITILCLLFGTRASLAKSGIFTGNVHPEPQLLTGENTLLARLRLRPEWLRKLPSRTFARWIDEERGIYLTTKGSVIGPYSALRSLSQQQRLSLLPRRLQNQGSQIHAHHIIEERVARAFGFDPGDIPAVLLPQGQHTGAYGIHTLINNLLPRGNRRTGSISYEGKLAKIQRAYQQVYARHGHDDWLDVITATISSWHSRQ